MTSKYRKNEKAPAFSYLTPIIFRGSTLRGGKGWLILMNEVTYSGEFSVDGLKQVVAMIRSLEGKNVKFLKVKFNFNNREWIVSTERAIRRERIMI